MPGLFCRRGHADWLLSMMWKGLLPRPANPEGGLGNGGEVKAASSAPGLDVDTAIGQLVRRMPSEADQSVSFALVVRDEPRSVEAAVRAPQRILDLLGMALYAVDEDGGVRQLFGRV